VDQQAHKSDNDSFCGAVSIWSGGARVVIVTLVGLISVIQERVLLVPAAGGGSGAFLRQLHYQELYFCGAFSLVSD